MSRAARIPTLLLTALLLAPALALSLLAAAPAAYAHEERESQFPPGNGSVPKHRSIGQARDVLVVCTKDSGKRIRALRNRKVRAFNQRLLRRCDHRNLQAAVDAVRRQRTNIYVLPGPLPREAVLEPRLHA